MLEYFFHRSRAHRNLIFCRNFEQSFRETRSTMAVSKLNFISPAIILNSFTTRKALICMHGELNCIGPVKLGTTESGKLGVKFANFAEPRRTVIRARTNCNSD